ncbi:condensation domain-containing protein, partial [Vibrio sp. TBV020]|uniref:condensation domain-containing protein n=1 Tax=Vibrio sp. TBV020 TaxID=3137398 RepID=UPI0038CD9888
KLYILDSERNLLPIGAVGELYIGGAGVAKGYLNKPELTKERFIDNPFATDSDKERGYTRLYKTGDLARWLPDGNIEYLGRNDFQVKIRGHRIELGEIDNALSIIEGVEQAVVIDRKDDTGRKYLAAYCVCASDNMDEEDLRMQLASKVPEFMMPSTFTFLESLPLTTNGKLDRRALPEPDLIDLSAYVAPATELETRLCTVWQQVLNLPKVGVYDHFFRIGGDSILSIQLVNALRKEGEYLQVKDIFECPTVKQLSQRLQETSSKEISAEQGELKGTFGLLPIQRLFFDKQLPNPNHFNQAFTLTVPNDWEPEAIVTSLKSLSDQHDMLRTHFKVNDLGEYEQTYTSESTLIELSVVNDEGWGDEERGAYLTGLHESLDVESNQLWRVVYFQRPNKEIGELCFIFHHLLIDAVSWRVISDDMKLLFEGQPLENKSSSYRQWVETLDQYASKHDSQRAYWESVVAQMELGTYPQVATNASPTMHQLTFNKERTEQLLTVSPQGYHTEVNDLLLSGLGLALKQVFGCDNPGVTLEGHGREGIDETIDSARTVGWFTTIYPVILPLGASVSDTIIQVKEQLRAIPDKGIGFGALMPTESKLPTVCFNYLGQLNGVDASEELWSLRAEQTGMSVSSENHDDTLLTLNGAVVDGQLGFTVLSSLQEEETQAFIKAFEESLYEVIEQSVLQAKLGGIKTASDERIKNRNQYIQYGSIDTCSQTLIYCPLGDMGYEAFLGSLVPLVSKGIHQVLIDRDTLGRFNDFESYADHIVTLLIDNDLISKQGCTVLGWSFGGVLAHFVATKLKLHGINVNCALLIDPLVRHYINPELKYEINEPWYPNLVLPFSDIKTVMYQCSVPIVDKGELVFSVTDLASKSKGLGFSQVLSDYTVSELNCSHDKVLTNDVVKSQLAKDINLYCDNMDLL